MTETQKRNLIAKLARAKGMTIATLERLEEQSRLALKALRAEGVHTLPNDLHLRMQVLHGGIGKVLSLQQQARTIVETLKILDLDTQK